MSNNGLFLLRRVMEHISVFVPYVEDKPFQDFVTIATQMLDKKTPTTQTSQQIEKYADDMIVVCYEAISKSDFIKGIVKHIRNTINTIAPYLAPREFLYPDNDLFFKPRKCKTTNAEKLDLTHAYDVNVFVTDHNYLKRVVSILHATVCRIESLTTASDPGPQMIGNIPMTYSGNTYKYKQLEGLKQCVEDLYDLYNVFEHKNLNAFILDTKVTIQGIVNRFVDNKQSVDPALAPTLAKAFKDFSDNLKWLSNLTSLEDNKYGVQALIELPQRYRAVLDFIESNKDL